MPSYFAPQTSMPRPKPNSPQAVPEEIQEADLVTVIMTLIDENSTLVAEFIALAATAIAEAEEALRAIRSAPIQA